jgi:hypothetical protein
VGRFGGVAVAIRRSIGMVIRQDMEEAVPTIIHPAMMWEERA